MFGGEQMFPFNNDGRHLKSWSTIQQQQQQQISVQQQQHQQATTNELHNDQLSLSSSDSTSTTMNNFYPGYGGNVGGGGGGVTNLGSSSNNHHQQQPTPQQLRQNTTSVSDGLLSSSGSGLGLPGSMVHSLANTSGHSQPQQASNQSQTLFSATNYGPYLDLFNSDNFSSLFSISPSSSTRTGTGDGVGLPNLNNHNQNQLGNSTTINRVSTSNNGINDGNSNCWPNKQSVIGHHSQQQQQQQFNPSGNLYTRGINMTQDEQPYYTSRVDSNYGSNFNNNFTQNPLTSDVLKQAVDSSINPLGLNHLTRRSNNNNNNKTTNDHTSHPFPSIQASQFNSSINVANSNLITSNIGRVGPIQSSVGTTNSILASGVPDCANVVGNLDPMGHHVDQLPSVSTHLTNLTMSSNGGPSTLYNNSTPSNKRLESQSGSTLQSNNPNLRSATNSLNNGTFSGGSNDHWTKQVIGPTLTSTLGNQSYGVDDSSTSYFTRDNRGLAPEDTFFSATTAGVQKQVETNMANLLLNQLGGSNSSNNSNDHLFQSTPSRSSSAIGTPYACGNNNSTPTNSGNSVGGSVMNSVFNVGIGLSVGNSNNSLGITAVSSPPNANNNSVAPTPSSNVVAAHVIGRASGSIRSSTPISNFPVNNAESVNSSTDSAFESGATSGQRLDNTTGLNTGSPSLSSSSGDIGETKKPSWASVASQPAKPVVKPKLMPSNAQPSKPLGLNNMENIGTWDNKTDGNLSSISNSSSNQIGLSHSSNKGNDGSSGVPNSWASPSQQGNRIVNKNSANVTNPSTLTASNGNAGLTSTNASLNMRQQGMIKNSSSMNHNGQTTGDTAFDANGSGNTSDLNRSKPTNLWSYNGLRVVNVSTSCSKSALVSLFSKFGRVKNIERINTSKTSELSIWVYYDNPNSPVEAAAKLQGAVIDNVSLDGLPLRIHFAPTDDQKDLKFSRPKQPPDNKGECYYWRTTNCFSREQCPLLHIPANKNIDAQIWMKMNKEQPTAVSTAKSK